jgi:SAM-dependent methyltransferase
MFSKSAALYDAIYSWKDYPGEALKLERLIEQHKQSPGRALLDVACGTGAHIPYLRQQFTVEGLDLDDALLDVARERNPGVPFHHADMVEFDLGRQFDIITCLFSAIGYVKTLPRLNQAIASMSKHLSAGGVLLLEPWLMPDVYEEGHPHAIFVDKPDIKIVRMNVSELEDNVSVLNFHYLVATPKGVEYFTERHELGLFSHDDYMAALDTSGLQAIFDSEGLMGRGLYIGRKPQS